MKSYLHLIIAGGALALICALALLRQKPAAAESAADAAGSNSAPVVAMAREDVQRDSELHRQHTEERLAALAQRDAAQQRYARAAAQSEESRRFLNRAQAPAWQSVIETNRALYLKLRAQAVQSPRGEVPCTICDGKSYLSYCVQCLANPGKCPTCQGDGHGNGDELCPTCLGNGKCFSCSGHGKMLCPYCDDGVIRADGRMPNFRLSE